MKKGNCMGRNIKCKPDHLCIAIFMLCLSVRFAEYFLIETDKTAVGENVLHKIVGMILLALVLCGTCSWNCLLCYFIWPGIGDFILQGPRTFRTVYQQFFANRLSNKSYGFRFLSVMRTIQCYECMDGGGRFRGLFNETGAVALSN